MKTALLIQSKTTTSRIKAICGRASGGTDDRSVNPVIVTLDFEGGLAAYQDGKPAPSETDKLHDKLIIMKAPSNMACGAPAFPAEDGHVTFVATDVLPRRYGLCKCPLYGSKLCD